MTIAIHNHMDRHRQNDWGSVEYDPRFDEYSVLAGTARQLLFYCPWCGERLPPSQRDGWFDELVARGIDPLADEIPAEFKSGTWRKGADVPKIGEKSVRPIEGRVLNLFSGETDKD